MQHVSSDLSKIPYGGFSPVRLQTGTIRRHLRRLRRLISGLKRRRPPDLVFPALSRGEGRDRRCVPVQRPLARRRVMLSRRLKRLLWPHPSFWRHSGRLIHFAGRSLPRGRGPEGPCFQLANPSVRAAFRTPADRAAQDDCTSARDSLRPNARGSASATSHLNRYTWVPLRGCEVHLMLRPEQLLALHRQGRLRSSFHSHESPHQNVEHDYAGKSSISRGRTYTGWTRSLAGCTALGATIRRGAEVVAADFAWKL